MKHWRIITMGTALALSAGVGLAQAGPVDIRYFASPRGTVNGGDLNQILTDTFNQSQQAIHVTYEPANASDWVTKVTVQMAGGNAPDVVAGWGDFMYAWLESGQALQLDGLLPANYFADFVPAAVKLFQVDGKQYGAPFYTGIAGFFYNTQMFDDAGLSRPDGSWNWDGFLADAKKLTLNDANGTTTQWGADVELDWSRMSAWVRQNGGSVVDPGVQVGQQVHFDSPQVIGAFQYLHDLIWNYHVAPSWPIVNSSPWDSFWAGNKLAIWDTGSWDAGGTQNNCKCSWDIAAKPAGPGGVRAAQMTQDGFMVYAHTQHPKEAVAFLQFLTSPQAEKIMMLQGNLQPSRLSLGLEYATNTSLAQKGLNMKVFVDQTKYAFSPPFFKNQSKVNDVLYPALDK
ncbi:MAG TPA: sugar ABC transporter substrate-binding protein, partial [Limnochordia bacterium]|nr:sugar ABC transporter substrate-binding protein [Limnochordia bacterium]